MKESLINLCIGNNLTNQAFNRLQPYRWLLSTQSVNRTPQIVLTTSLHSHLIAGNQNACDDLLLFCGVTELLVIRCVSSPTRPGFTAWRNTCASPH